MAAVSRKHYACTLLLVTLLSAQASSTTAFTNITHTTIVSQTSSQTPYTTRPTTTQPPLSKYMFTYNTPTNNYFITLSPGGTTQLDCQIRRTSSTPNITWLKDGQPIQTKIFRFFYISDIFQTFNLGFDNILFEEAGTFKCIVGNEDDVKISKTFHIEVKDNFYSGALQVESILPINPQIIRGEDFQFTCIAKGENDLPRSFRWDLLTQTRETSSKNIWKSPNYNIYYKIETLKVEKCSKGNNTLVLKDVSYQLKDGIISCIVYNQQRFDRKAVRLFIKDRPIIETSSGKSLTVVIVIIIILLVIITTIAAVYMVRRKQLIQKRKRTHSYHYDSPPQLG